MKSALKKSPIPDTHSLLVKILEEPIFDPNWHFHREYQLFVVLQGRGTRFIGDNVRPFKEGEVTFTGPDLPHLWQSDPDSVTSEKNTWSRGIVVYFQDDLIGERLLQKEESIKLRTLLQQSLRGIQLKGGLAGRVTELLQKLTTAEGFKQVLLVLEILHTLSESDQWELLTSPGYTNTLKEGDTERMNKVYNYTMNNFRRRITVSEMADLTHMTPTSFSRYFKAHANKTFSEFISEIRIGHACKLLIEQNASCNRACYDSGFNTLSNFNKQFRRITKTTPKGYKKKYGFDITI